MRVYFPILAIPLFLFGSVLGLAQEQDELETPTISVDVQVVNILATVRDKKGGLVTTLSKEDFVLEEDGKRQEIKYFSQQTDLPLTIGILVDTSVSQQRLLAIERTGAYEFFEKLLRMEKDLAFLISFDVDIELLQDFTDSKELLYRGLERLKIQGSGGGMHPSPTPSGLPQVGTAMYDSIYLAAEEMLKGQVGRKALVLVGDGNDYGSRIKPKEAIASAQRADAIIYSVRYFDREFYFATGGMGTGGEGSLKKLSRETGGTMFEVSRKKPLRWIMDQISAELRSQYLIGYTPQRDLSQPGFRKLKLRAKRKGLKVQARAGYYPDAMLD